MEKLFSIKQRGSNYRTEIIGGITTFFAMAYIIFVNPQYLSMTGMDYNAVMIATCVSAAIGCFLTGFLANVPFAQAPAMGLSTFFTFTLCNSMGYTWQQGLAIVFISGVLFLIVTISPLRSLIISSIPAPLKNAISVGIGLFITFIGLINSGIIVAYGPENSHTGLGTITSGAPLLTIIGLIIIAILIAYKVKAAIFIGIIITTIIGIPMNITEIPSEISLNIGALSNTFIKMDFNLLSLGILPLITAILSFLIVDLFDSIGTLIGTASNVGMLDEDGNLPKGDRALIADAVATCIGATLGTSTISTFIESSTGIQAGARTGLAAIVVGILFLLSTFLVPIAGIVPSAATAPALIVVGVFMIKGATRIDWSDFEIAVPCFLTITIMPFAYSIVDGIGFGFISYVVLKLARGKWKEIPVLLYILSVLFVTMYILSGII